MPQLVLPSLRVRPPILWSSREKGRLISARLFPSLSIDVAMVYAAKKGAWKSDNTSHRLCSNIWLIIIGIIYGQDNIKIIFTSDCTFCRLAWLSKTFYYMFNIRSMTLTFSNKFFRDGWLKKWLTQTINVILCNKVQYDHISCFTFSCNIKIANSYLNICDWCTVHRIHDLSSVDCYFGRSVWL